VSLVVGGLGKGKDTLALTCEIDILGKKNRSFFYQHNVFFNATNKAADILTMGFDWVLVGVLKMTWKPRKGEGGNRSTVHEGPTIVPAVSAGM
jgi:hypothetical protein